MSSSETLQKEIGQTAGFHSSAQAATIAILRTADVVRRRLSAAVEPAGVTLQQYNVLRILRGARGKPMATLDIGDRLIERTPGITRLLDRLAGKGLVRRERSEDDRRLVQCWITDKGQELLKTLDDVVDQADEVSASGLAENDLNRLLRILEQVRQNG
jgi:DNA-binding MarR family transcriptional regulator